MLKCQLLKTLQTFLQPNVYIFHYNLQKMLTSHHQMYMFRLKNFKFARDYMLFYSEKQVFKILQVSEYFKKKTL